MAMTPTLVAHTPATEVLLTHEDGEEEGSTVSPLATDDGFEGQGAAGDRVMVVWFQFLSSAQLSVVCISALDGHFCGKFHSTEMEGNSL